MWYDPALHGEFDIPIGAQVKAVTTDSLVFRTEEGEVISSTPNGRVHKLGNL